MEYCPHCMRRTAGMVCDSCGRNINVQSKPGHLPIRTLLNGTDGHTYMIGEAIGQGGFGITYIAVDTDTGERAAIKEYFPSLCASRTMLGQVTAQKDKESFYSGGMESFMKEAYMLSAVGALPSVVTVRDCFTANGTAYIVMEYVDGIALHRAVAERGRIPAAELLPQLPSLLHDLETLHQAGVIHRDISPDNIMLLPDSSLKLIDFGSARNTQDGKALTVLLKPGFSPVEQYQTRGQGPWTDVYALAGTIYYCLTGTIPPEAVARLEGDEMKPPTHLGAELTAEQEAALLWGMTVQPKQRPISVEVFAAKLFPGFAMRTVHRTVSEPTPETSPAPPKTAQDTPKNDMDSQRKRKLIIGVVAIAAIIVIGFLASVFMEELL